eukprot:scaffold544_cov66-Phaeocystis_antarctica.AAC.2
MAAPSVPRKRRWRGCGPVRACRAAATLRPNGRHILCRAVSRPRARWCTRMKTVRPRPCTARPRRTSPSSARRWARASSRTRTGGSR